MVLRNTAVKLFNMQLVAVITLLALSLVPSSSCDISPPLKLGSWNVQRFGLAKASDPQKLDVIVKVVRRYDIILLLEVRDSRNKTLPKLLQKVNEGHADQYAMTVSERVGRTSQKEQYAFFYKQGRVSVLETYPIDDSVHDIFQYDPFIVTFSISARRLTKLAILALHAKPSDAETEIDKLVDVYEDFKASTGLEDVLIMGDLNAGCDYVTSTEWPYIRLRSDPRFTWLISDHEDTTTKYTTCPYDRLIAAGDNLLQDVYVNSARPFYFDEAYNLTSDLTEGVSDHYPVELSLRPYVEPFISQHIQAYSSVAVTDVRAATGIPGFISGVWGTSTCNTERGIVASQWQASSLTEVKDTLSAFRVTYPGILSNDTMNVLNLKLDSGALTDSSLYGMRMTEESYIVEVLCVITTKYCSVNVKRTTLIS